MRRKFLVFATVALLAGGCWRSTSGPQPPPPLDKQLLTGKWKSKSDLPLILTYEFAEDGVLRLTIRGIDQPLTGRYSWNGERTLNLEYQRPADFQQAYEAAAKGFKQEVADRIKAGTLPERAGPGIMRTARDTWPANETVRVALSEKPRILTVVSEGEASQNFDPIE
jgi:hypothetical protein